MIRSASSTTTSEPVSRSPVGLAALVVLVLIALVVIITGVGFAATAGGSTHYACMSISHQGSDEKITTSGLLHYLDSGYYVTCNEGSSLPTSSYKASCLTISPKTVPAAIGLGASTQYYYISSTGGSITLQGAPTPVNATEFTNPSGITITVAC